MKLIPILLISLMIMTGLAVMVPANEVQALTSGDYTYSTVSGGCEITGYIGIGGNITVPSSLDGYPVLGFTGSSLQYNAVITGITVPNTVIDMWGLAPYAFANMVNLVYFKDGNNASIGANCFTGDISLNTVILGNNCSFIENSAFSGCYSTGFTTLIVPASVNYFGTYVFNGDYYLNNITFNGLISPTVSSDTWVSGISPSARGHALLGSNFPAPGDYFHSLLMGNYTIINIPTTNSTITDGRVPNQWKEVDLLQGSFPNYYQGTPFVTWKNTEYGQVQESNLPFQIQSTSTIFKPGYSQVVTMKLQLEIYDVTQGENNKLTYLYVWPMQVSDGNASHVYQFANGNVSLAQYETDGTGYTNEFINQNLEAGHKYYLVYDMRIADMNGTPLPTTTFSGVVTTILVITSNQQSWINGLIWIMILFTPVWLLNWFFPRYGFLLGMAIMAIMLGITESGFYYVSIIILATIGLMSYTISKGD